jgi:hypothetical protein
MPCSDWGREPDPDVLAERSAKVQEQKQRLDRMTRMLCGICRRVQHGVDEATEAALIESDLELAAWWREHQEIDRQRLVEEARGAAQLKARIIQEEKDAAERAKALRMLTPRQRKLLGLKEEVA